MLKREAVQKVEESFDKAKQSAARWVPFLSFFVHCVRGG